MWLNHPLPYTVVVELPLRYTPPSPETLNQVAGYVRSCVYISLMVFSLWVAETPFLLFTVFFAFFQSLLLLYVHCVLRSLSERAEGFPLRNTREDNSCRSFEVRGVAVILELLNVLHTLTPVL